MTERKPQEPRRDAGAYIGRKPERATETVPGGSGRDDRRVPAVARRPGQTRGPAPEGEGGAPREGHREGPPVSDDQVREAGQDR